ncbi:hypothetical protein JOF55_003097 [Haloactinomyces albus]|uniref:Uncharacterized protein n=1 Tax=Haloactinomyces albus TaxID=1352928 RepID=A0AAE3ZDJ8_9ACTN|nr:hypothetical protein [Haloactinomyces albus]
MFRCIFTLIDERTSVQLRGRIHDPRHSQPLGRPVWVIDQPTPARGQGDQVQPPLP